MNTRMHGDRAPTRRERRTRLVALTAATLVTAVLAPVTATSSASAAPVGQGFNLNASDLRFIYKQIRIAERHVAATDSSTGPCGAMLGDGADQIPANGVGVTLPWGLRTVDGTCNNIEVDQAEYGAADRTFPRLVPKQLKDAEGGTSYTSDGAMVLDSQPRVISNLIVDQTADNPAAVAAAGEDAPTPPAGEPYFIPNVATDVGLSAPYNSWFTLFGQFFDHGLDLVNKGGNGSVMIPLKSDDPLYEDGAPNFMMLSRATHSGDHEAVNQTSPFVDQSQTYTSNPSHQVFLRHYDMVGADGLPCAGPDYTGCRPVASGRLLTGADGGMATWADVKQQAAEKLGLLLTDSDALAIPTVLTDPYGRFVRATDGNGLPQLVLTSGELAAGDLASPVGTAGVRRTGHAFLDDIAHNAIPKSTFVADADDVVTPSLVPCQRPGFPVGCVDEYDDEMLDAHFIAGDGRVNENIGLTAVHQVFHAEHNRLIPEIETILDSDAMTDAERAAWRTPDTGSGWDYGERLFQAAKFVNEMEYQHLVFEEFARKVQPMVNVFGEGGTGYHSNIDPAIRAEFAHAVYRFGHSMLTETVDRVRADGTPDPQRLFDVFLNPPAFMDGYATAEAAAGSIVRGMTRQVGNELDEFVTEALRNQLLGLPLDLPALNIARARDTGIPTLNAARRAFYADTADPGLTPYTSWADFGLSLKHSGSLVNFIAAYGTHGDITSETTLAGKRAAAEAILAGPAGIDGVVGDDPGTPDVDEAADDGPPDSYAFLNSTTHTVLDPGTGVEEEVRTWVSQPNGVTTTGVDTVDLWVGGLAEKQNVFGGLLGPTFNYVFEGQLEDLQDGDRFYYLSRTAGLNLLTQLEGNSFAELVQRNTDVEGLPADSFSRPDFVFDLAKQNATGPIVQDDATEWDETQMLTREPNGTIRYSGPAHVVFNGSDTRGDLVRSSEGDDTLRGNGGDDRLEGGDGADNLVGGLGDDILTDLFGDDTIKGGDGNDAISSGRGFGGDLNQGGRGHDFVVGGNDITETFAGPGNDFVFAGDAEDTVFGDDGDDWIEGGKGPFNLLQGDNGAPFQDDPNEPGHDVLFSYGGEQDYDAEGGDDVMLLGPGIQRSEGMLGFDWTSHKSDPQAGNSDMDITGLLPPSVETNRDRFDLVEGLSGWRLNDTLRGDSRDAAAQAGHELNADGVARIANLQTLLGGATSFVGGNILLGGAGSDLIEGRGGDDLIDGDAWLDVQLSAPDNATPETADRKRVDTMAGLRAEVFAGTLNPGDIRIERTVVLGDGAGTDRDTAVYSGARADYTITPQGDGSVLVSHDNAGADGTDRLRNVEELRFTDATVQLDAVATVPSAPTITSVVAGDGSVTVSFTGPTDDGGSAVTGFEIGALSGTAPAQSATAAAGATSAVVSGLTNGTTYTIVVRAVNAVGASVDSAPSAPVTPATAPGAPTGVSAVGGNAQATVTWTAPTSDGGSPITGYTVQVRVGTAVNRTVTGMPATPTSATVTGLTNGTAYNFVVLAVNATGTGPGSTASNTVTPNADQTAPVLTGRNPAAGATRVNRGINVSATFNERMQGQSNDSIWLTNPAGTRVAAVVTLSGNQRQVTLNPSANLAAGTVYTVHIDGGPTALRDLAGNAAADTTWAFTTR